MFNELSNLMIPFFNPGPINFNFPKICLAAVNIKMASLSGDISDGVILHGFSTKKYIQKVLLPAIVTGKKYFILKNDFMITTGGFLIVSNDDKKIQKDSSWRLVSTSQPSDVTARVCSHCADKRRSLVVTVQPSAFDNLVWRAPRFIIGSMVKVMPSCNTSPVSGLP